MMQRFSIALGTLALLAAATSNLAQAQCCGGHSKHDGATAAKAAPQVTQQAAPAQAGNPKGSRLPADPVTGAPIDFAFKTMEADGPVYFANEAALAKFQEDPKAFAARVNEQRAALAKLPRVQVNCPIMGDPIDGKTFAYVQGQGVYFCCPGCVPKYSAEPAKYAANLAASFTYQTRCPVDGATIDPTVFTELATGPRVYFCSPSDSEKFAKAPATYAASLAEQGIGTGIAKPNAQKAEVTNPPPADPMATHAAHQHGS